MRTVVFRVLANDLDINRETCSTTSSATSFAKQRAAENPSFAASIGAGVALHPGDSPIEAWLGLIQAVGLQWRQQRDDDTFRYRPAISSSRPVNT